MNICVYGASSNDIDIKYIEAGEKLGKSMAKRGIGLVFGGGATGLMGATARGMTAGGGYIVGVTPRFFSADGIIYDKCDELIRTDTMRERKQTMEDRADAFIMTPGGIGTFEEFFEILTLKQLHRHNKAIVVMNTMGYFDHMDAMVRDAIKQGFVSANVFELYEVLTDVDEILDYIESYKPIETDIRRYKNV